MVIGKTTSTSISKTEICTKFSEAQILCKVFPEITSIPCKIKSPFRVDNHPSFGVFMGDNKHIYYRDFGDSEEKGSLFDLLCKYWNCSFDQCLDKICELMVDENKDIQIKTAHIKTLTRKESNQLNKIQVVVRPWRDYDYEYWKSYGIDSKWLKYAEVYPISHKIITKKESIHDKGKNFIFSADKYAYAFVERKEGKVQLKIYQPKNKKGFKWCSSMDSSVISLWTKVPEYGDKIVICSSLKDALCLSANLHIPAIAPQGEGYNISDTACKELKRRFKKIFICFDVDKPGLKDSKLLADKTGFINVVPDLGTEKDISDYYKSLKDKQQFQKLKDLF